MSDTNPQTCKQLPGLDILHIENLRMLIDDLNAMSGRLKPYHFGGGITETLKQGLSKFNKLYRRIAQISVYTAQYSKWILLFGAMFKPIICLLFIVWEFTDGSSNQSNTDLLASVFGRILVTGYARVCTVFHWFRTFGVPGTAKVIVYFILQFMDFMQIFFEGTVSVVKSFSYLKTFESCASVFGRIYTAVRSIFPGGSVATGSFSLNSLFEMLEDTHKVAALIVFPKEVLQNLIGLGHYYFKLIMSPIHLYIHPSNPVPGDINGFVGCFHSFLCVGNYPKIF